MHGHQGGAVRLCEDTQGSRPAARARLVGRTVVRQRAQQFVGHSCWPGGMQSIPEVEPKEMAKQPRSHQLSLVCEESTRYGHSGSGVSSVKNLSGLCAPTPRALSPSLWGRGRLFHVFGRQGGQRVLFTPFLKYLSF